MSESSYRPEGATSAEGGGREATTGAQVQERAREGAQQVTERVREGAQQVTGQVQEKAQEARGQASNRLREQVDQRSTRAGEQVRSVAGAARKTGETLRSEGNERPAQIVEQAAERIERLGRYLEQTDGDRLLRDVEEFGRRRPWAVAGVGAVFGFLGARFLKASSEQRYQGSAGDRASTAPRPAAQDFAGREPGPETGVEPVATTAGRTTTDAI